MSDTTLDPEVRAAQAEAREAEYARRLLAHEAAAAVGLPASHARRLQGTTREEMEADALDLLDTLVGEWNQRRPRTNANAGDEGLGNAGGGMSRWIRDAARGVA